MQANSDFRDLFAELNAAGAEYLVVGAHALAAHGHVRATKDLDVWIRASPENASRVYRALGSFGAPLHGLSVEDLAGPDLIFQIGVPPVRIDIITSIDGVEFDSAWRERMPSEYGDQRVHVLSRRHLIENKKASAGCRISPTSSLSRRVSGTRSLDAGQSRFRITHVVIAR